MPPKKSGTTSVKPADAQWLFTALQHISEPAYINTKEAATALNTKTHTVTCKISDLRKKYGLNIAGTSGAGGGGSRSRQRALPPPVPIETVKQTDIDWFTTAVSHVANSVTIPVNDVAVALKTKPHTITCRISTLRKQYGLNLAGSSQISKPKQTTLAAKATKKSDPNPREETRVATSKKRSAKDAEFDGKSSSGNAGSDGTQTNIKPEAKKQKQLSSPANPHIKKISSSQSSGGNKSDETEDDDDDDAATEIKSETETE